MKNDYNFEENRYESRVRITPEDLEWLKKNKGTKSAAAFLEDILKYIRKSQQFWNKK